MFFNQIRLKMGLFLIFILASPLTYAQTIVGKWKAVNNNKPSSLIQIYRGSNGKYYGKMVEIYDPELAKNICSKCPDNRKGKKMKDLVIIRDLKINADKKSAEGGKILDPKKGKEYNCKVWLEGDNTLKMRAFVGFLYGTRTWTRQK